MVGRLGTVRSKQSPTRESRNSDLTQPPPPYDHASDPSVILAGTTTTRTEIVTTTTTTHFFSLPLWRKRGFASSNSTPRNTLQADVPVDEHGLVSLSEHPGIVMVDKALPPTPPGEEDSPRHATGQSSPQHVQILYDGARARSMPPTSFSPVDARMPPKRIDEFPPTMQSTTALARATLGLGLPHILPHISPSSSSIEVNTVGFTQQELPSHDIHPMTRGVRRTKSTNKLKTIFSSEKSYAIDSPSGDDDLRRTRGLSFGSSSILSFGAGDTLKKGKDKDVDAEQPPVSATSTRSLARRASFWSRKKISTEVTELVPEPPKTQLAPLPTLQPISPFNMDITITPSSPSPGSGSRRAHSRALSRSHSARSPSRPTPPISQNSYSNVRPATAGPSIPGTPNTPSPTISPPSASYSDTWQPHSAEELPPKPRPRAQTNPPLFNRLSLNRPSTSSSTAPSLPRISFHSPNFSRPTSTSSFSSISKGRKNVSQLTIESPNHSNTSSGPSVIKNSPARTIPAPSGKEESPGLYLRRLEAAVSKAEIAGILASSTDTFHVQALRTYIEQFDFISDPLDVALRKLLMEVGLPRETQQIDRVIEAFAGRYLQCNPSLFTSEDHPYILAFSLIMLHTDAFNKSNKRKMTKAGYVKNTRLPGVASEVLDCFYDNIVFAPFIFIEDPLDVNGQRGLEATSSPIVSNGNTTGTPIYGNQLLRTSKVDPYYLIINNLLGPLRVDVEAYVPTESPYSYEGTAGPWDEDKLQHAFAKASEIEVGAGLATPIDALESTTSASTRDIWTLKVTKIGLLNRKDDVLEGGKKASNRKWKSWSVILTGSQLLFFRDPSWASSLLAAQSAPSDGHTIFPQATVFKPDELLSVKDAIAVFDISYVKYKYTLRFVLADGRQLLLQASDEKDLNEWIAGINYASAFKSAGVRMRPLDMSGTDVKLTGVAAATSHLHDLQHQNHSNTSHIWDDYAAHELMGMLSGDAEGTKPPTSKRKATSPTGHDDDDTDVPIAPEVDGAEQFKATFDQVKADLAAGRWAFPNELQQLGEDPEHESISPASGQSLRLFSRSQIIQSKVEDLESRITAAQSQLDANMRFVRNIATLTPFQKSTRDRLTVAVQGIAQRVAQVRLEMEKLNCHRNVLVTDLAAEGRSWRRVTNIALQAATETLQNRHLPNLPRMTLSLHNGPLDATLSNAEPSSYHLDNSLKHRPESSICESFHSAIDFGPDWPSVNDTTSSSFLDTRYIDSPRPSSSDSLHTFSFPDEGTESPRLSPHLSSNNIYSSDGISPQTNGDLRSHEKFYTAHESPEEEAEDWNQTRCAQRVSLVRLPSDIHLTSRFSRHGARTLQS